ncbi:MAG: molybdopterin-dependent oxidoreductase [Rhodospirillaceae bacterium]|nr:molybdopterin-dependent oxidoreductase [Rhodospirillaceae bacterium]MBT5457833.1 molybdopterin-dependent oxidoreductase [Rhodospirillaceae bacterium]
MATKFRNSSHWGAFLAEVEDGRLTGIQPFEHDPDPSPMLKAIPESVHAPSRVTQPMVREGWLKNGPGSGKGRGAEPFVPVSWEKALELVSGELSRVKETYSNEAIFGGSYGWASAGIFHYARTQLRRFLFAFGGCVDQATNYSFGTATAFVPHIVGDLKSVTGPMTTWGAVAKHSEMLILFGGANPKNTQVARGGCVAHARLPSLQQVAEAGVDVVNVSPCRDDTPDFLNPQWVPVRPNTDAALMLALAHTLIVEDLHDSAFLESHCAGFERVGPYLMGEIDGQPKDADWGAAITGIDADTIRDLARRMGAKRTLVSAAWSLQRADHGEMTYWSLILLASVLGHIGLPGGGFTFGYGSSGGMGDADVLFNPPSLSGGKNPINYAIPAARIADALMEPGKVIDFNGKKITYPDIKLIYWAGGNPFHHHQDLNRFLEGWQKPDTIIVHEPWWTATARHADIVLPATTTLERNDIGSNGRDPYLSVMEKAIEPVGEARNDFDILSDLSRQLGCEEEFTEGRDEDEWLRFLYESCRQGAQTNEVSMPDFDSFWKQGWFRIPDKEEDFTMFTEFRSDPVAKKLRTKSGKVELYSDKIAKFDYDDCPPHATWIEPAEWLGSHKAAKFPLHMISSQPKTRLHSQMDCGPVAGSTKVAGREPVAINPEDAAARGISDGDLVRLFNDRGACLAGAVVTGDLMPGAIRLYTGAWYDPVDGGKPGSLDRHGNPNMLTLDKGTSKLGQGPSAQTALVEIELYKEDAPDVSVFEAPETVEA